MLNKYGMPNKYGILSKTGILNKYRILNKYGILKPFGCFGRPGSARDYACKQTLALFRDGQFPECFPR